MTFYIAWIIWYAYCTYSQHKRWGPSPISFPPGLRLLGAAGKDRFALAFLLEYAGTKYEQWTEPSIYCHLIW